MTVGPTLHYSHNNVQSCWLLALVAFALTALFWSKIVTGSFWSFDFMTALSPHLWRLDRAATGGVSIFEYPWQILVLGLLMGILAVVPVLISQLMCFSYSVPFVLVLFFFANLPAFALFVLLSCFAAACRPLRFRSRIIAIALCTAPQLLYWGIFGGARPADPIKWGCSFAPWVCAWFVGLGIAGLVLGIGHFTRYRPGLVWLVTSLFLVLAFITFDVHIGFDELDYQLYVAKNNPEDVVEFRDHSITEALDRTITDPQRRAFFAGFFYPSEPIPLRTELKKEIVVQLRLGSWPQWFQVPPELNFEEKKAWLFNQYNTFIKRRPNSRRMPIALYYKAILSEYKPDLNKLMQQEVLHFYSDYPNEASSSIWWTLYARFADSPESCEARWRIAWRWAGQGRFEQADRLAAEAQQMVTRYLEKLRKQPKNTESLFSLFRPPPTSVMTQVKFEDLQMRLNHLRSLIGPENRTDQPQSRMRLARFVMLDPHTIEYDRYIEELYQQTDANDPLRDNILLARVKRIPDDHRRAEKLAQLHKKFQNTDGGKEALYELARLKILLYQNQQDPELKKQYLAEARATLTSFLSLYPNSFCAEQVRNILRDLPQVN